MFLIDTHAHLNDEKFTSDLDDVIARAEAADVKRIIVCGCDLASSRAAIDLSERYESVYATVGVHPHDAKHYNPVVGRMLIQMAENKKVLAIGEIGLDFHYDFSPREDQFAAFEAQVELAAEVGLPIIVHSRESNPEVLQVLSNKAAKISKCVFHCFSGDEDFVQQVLDLGYYIGVDGPITYKASEKLRRVIQVTPLERILIETDCPYLTPIPYRGKRNEPAYVRLVAEEVARVKEIPLEELAEITTRNAFDFFGDRLRGG